MGQGGSTLRLSGSPDAYKKSAELAAKLPDDLLTLFFKSSDLLDLLALADLNKCPYYVFTTAAAMEQLFTQIKVSPKRGKAGEIRFASLSQLSPAIPPPSGVKRDIDQAALQAQTSLCVEVAYFFVRTFQIYTALSLTIMDTDPTRRTSIRPTVANPMRTKSGPRSVPFAGGGTYQSGGGVSKTFGQRFNPKLPGNPLNDTIFSPLSSVFSVKQGLGPVITLESNRFSFDIEFPADFQSFVQRTDTSKEFPIYYLAPGKNRVPLAGRLEKTSQTSTNFYLAGELVDTFLYITNRWTVETDNGQSASEQTLVDTIAQSMIEIASRSTLSNQGRISAVPNRTTTLGGPVSLTYSGTSSGRAAFEGFEEVKAPFFNRGKKEGKIPFPKAYAVGRAMQLLSPIFQSEKAPNDPYRTQICSKNLDFESPQYPYLPREDRQLRSNIYFRSLVALYYDAYQIRGKDLQFIKTETGNTDLRKASQTLGKLYGISESEGATFLEGSAQFRRASSLCTLDSRIDIQNDNLVRELQQKIIKPLLDLQQAHNKKVESLLRKMFSIQYEKDKVTPAKLKFVSSYLSGGNDAVNKLGKEARDLLLDYYWKSEGYYILGIQMLERNKDYIKATL